MAELNETEKLSVVTWLAQFRTHSETIALVKETFDKEMTFQSVRIYDCSSPYFESGERWREIFNVVRKQYLEDVAAVPVASQAYRLHLIQRGIEAAVRKGKWADAVVFAEQGAKEVGGILTNQRHMTIDGKGKARDLTTEERKEQLYVLLDEAMAGRKPVDQAPGTSQ